jgi:hypothetical protein
MRMKRGFTLVQFTVVFVILLLVVFTALFLMSRMVLEQSRGVTMLQQRVGNLESIVNEELIKPTSLGRMASNQRQAGISQEQPKIIEMKNDLLERKIAELERKACEHDRSNTVPQEQKAEPSASPAFFY